MIDNFWTRGQFGIISIQRREVFVPLSFEKINQLTYSLKLHLKLEFKIKINPEKRFGKPCVRNTRISVYDVLSRLASGMTIPEILEDFPELKEEDVKACLAYAADREHGIRVA